MPNSRAVSLRYCKIKAPSAMAFSPRQGAEAIAKCEHVGIGTDAWIAKIVPGTADGSAPFDDGPGKLRAARLQVMSGCDAGNPGANDQYIDGFAIHGWLFHWVVDSVLILP